ncbi:MAG: hypothetical protein ACI8Z1_001470 [Candidatus Azotimanducaceae bacterium]|jgi:hypothetical protein
MAVAAERLDGVYTHMMPDAYSRQFTDYSPRWETSIDAKNPKPACEPYDLGANRFARFR